MAQVKSLTINGKDIIDLIYPVGSFYMSTETTPPQELFGGTWEQIKGRFLVGVGSIEENSSDWFGNVAVNGINIPVGEKGGEYEHSLTVEQIASHSHTPETWTVVVSPGGNTGRWRTDSGNVLAAYTHTTGQSYRTGSTGGGQAHNNMPPYYATYIWHRTA